MRVKNSVYQQTLHSKLDTTGGNLWERYANSNDSQTVVPLETPLETSGAAKLHSQLEEILDLQTTSVAMIADAMHDGVDHGYRGKWRDQSFDTHLDHAIMHLLALKYPREGDMENHLEHACFRVVAAGTVQEGDYSGEESGLDFDRWESEGGSTVGESGVVGEKAGTYRFENGEAVGHPSGVEPRLKQPNPDTYPAAPEPISWHCSRCGGTHPYLEPYVCKGIL